jgi:hypothetical protein
MGSVEVIGTAYWGKTGCKDGRGASSRVCRFERGGSWCTAVKKPVVRKATCVSACLDVNLDILVLFLGLRMPLQKIRGDRSAVWRTHQIGALEQPVVLFEARCVSTLSIQLNEISGDELCRVS